MRRDRPKGCLNWTKVGLKVRRMLAARKTPFRLNWTKVGLKAPDRRKSFRGQYSGLNWTKVGLKGSSGSRRREGTRRV